MRNLLFLLPLLPLLFTQCKYNKLLKSNDLGLKYEEAKKYYAIEKYIKAYPLLDELNAAYRGQSKGKEILYMLSYTDFYLKDYPLAAYRFKEFYTTYPSSAEAEEAYFMNAMCYYFNSPGYELDQMDTKAAIEQFQNYLTRYPTTEKVDTVNQLMDKLRAKLELKTYESAKLYYNRDLYKAAIVALNNAIEAYPGSPYVLEMRYLTLKAKYDLARNSVSSKKVERFEDTMKTYATFADRFSGTKYLREAENIYSNAQRELAKLQKQDS